MRLNHEQASCYYIDGITHSFNVHREAGKACFFHSAQRFDWVVTDLLLQSESEGGKVVNSERRTWVTIYITLKWDPDHVFLSVRLHDQLMDTQKLTGFLFHCSKSHLFRVFWGFPLCFLAWLHFRGEAKVLSVVFFSHLPHFLGVSVSFIWDFSSLFKKKFQPDRLLFCVYINPSFPPALLFLPFSSIPHLLVCRFWAMLSSPTVILQPYGLPVYPQATTCYPSIVQVNFLIYTVARHYHINTEIFPPREHPWNNLLGNYNFMQQNNIIYYYNS